METNFFWSPDLKCVISKRLQQRAAYEQSKEAEEDDVILTVGKTWKTHYHNGTRLPT